VLPASAAQGHRCEQAGDKLGHCPEQGSHRSISMWPSGPSILEFSFPTSAPPSWKSFPSVR
jgi:hypothetical protein